MKVNLNREFNERYLLSLEYEDKLQESVASLIKEHLEGKIPADLFIKSLDIGTYTIQEIYRLRKELHKVIKQIRYHLFKMKEYIEINYEDGIDFIVAPSQEYAKLHDDFLQRSNRFIKEWDQYNKEHGLCIPDTRTETRSFELVFKMIQLLLEEYDAHVYPDEELVHIYVLTRELPGLLFKARDLALNMKPRIITDQYYMQKYLNKPLYSSYNSNLQRHFHNDYEFKQARANGYPDFEYVREPGFRPRVAEQRRHHDLVPESQRHQLMTGDIGQFRSNQFGERLPLQTTGQMTSNFGQSTIPPGPKLQRPNIRGGVYPGTISEQPTIENAGKRMVHSGSGQPVYPGRPELRQEPSEETNRKS